MATKRVIPRDQISQAFVEGMVKRACMQFVDNNPDATSEVGFLVGATFVLKMVAEFNVPWLPRNSVSDAGEAIGKEAIRRRDRVPGWDKVDTSV